MNEMPYYEKIISGKHSYCQKIMNEYTQHGYRLIKWKAWSDRKYTFVLRKDK